MSFHSFKCLKHSLFEAPLEEGSDSDNIKNDRT